MTRKISGFREIRLRKYLIVFRVIGVVSLDSPRIKYDASADAQCRHCSRSSQATLAEENAPQKQSVLNKSGHPAKGGITAGADPKRRKAHMNATNLIIQP